VLQHFAVGIGVYIIDKLPAFTAVNAPLFADLRKVFTVVINAPDDTFRHQVCQTLPGDEERCHKPDHCKFSRCYIAAVPHARLSAVTDGRMPDMELPDIHLLPAPIIYHTHRASTQHVRATARQSAMNASTTMGNLKKKYMMKEEPWEDRLGNSAASIRLVPLAAGVGLILALGVVWWRKPSLAEPSLAGDPSQPSGLATVFMSVKVREETGRGQTSNSDESESELDLPEHMQYHVFRS